LVDLGDPIKDFQSICKNCELYLNGVWLWRINGIY